MANLVGKVNVSSVMAPYNFVPFADKVIAVSNEDMLVRGDFKDELLTGEISYTVEAKTPIFVDDGNAKFYRDEYNRIAIPGTTMRGLVRANSQILGMASYENDIEDYRLMYRNVANGAEKRRYGEILGAGQVPLENGASVSVLKNVRAGYIAKEHGKYYIYGTTVEHINDALGEMNYYILSERHISSHYKDKEFAFFRKHPEYTQNHVEKKFEEYIDRGRTHYSIRTYNKEKGKYVDVSKNDRYKPYIVEISYAVKNSRYICAVGEPGEYANKGYLLGSGYMKEKKVLYIIPEMDKKICIDIEKVDKQSLDSFKYDFNMRENALKQYRAMEFFNLPKEGTCKPVFYIQLDGHLYFGFTPRLRLFYDHSVKEGYRQKTSRFDYAKSLFGCIDGKTGYKSKVSFTDALADNEVGNSVEYKVALSSPKPTSYLDYLCQNEGNAPTNYNTENFTLRGTKRYWLHEDLVPSDPTIKDSVKSSINALVEGAKFNGKVRFQNLTSEELGLLLWSLKLEDNSEVNLGKAKSYGFGRCKIGRVKVRLVDYSKAYDMTSLVLNPFIDAGDGKEYIQLYKDAASKQIGVRIEKTSSVNALLVMCDATRIPNNEKTRYMSLGKKEFQTRVNDLTPLPTPEQVVNHCETAVEQKDNEIKADNKQVNNATSFEMNTVYIFKVIGYENGKDGKPFWVKLQTEDKKVVRVPYYIIVKGADARCVKMDWTIKMNYKGLRNMNPDWKVVKER